MPELSGRLLKTHAEAFSRFADHRFFTMASDGTLPDRVRDAYFLYERRFVEQAVVILALLLSKAPDLASRRHLNSMIHGLLYDQIDLFDGIFARLDLSPVDDVPDEVQAFCTEMTQIAQSGSYVQGIAAMFVAETTYAEVSRRMKVAQPPDLFLRDWFALHTTQTFVEGAQWLAAEIDRIGEKSDPDGSLDAAVVRAINLEISFHDAAFAVGKT
jgi:thiaminase/transcriptional activator TenA